MSGARARAPRTPAGRAARRSRPGRGRSRRAPLRQRRRTPRRASPDRTQRASSESPAGRPTLELEGAARCPLRKRRDHEAADHVARDRRARRRGVPGRDGSSVGGRNDAGRRHPERSVSLGVLDDPADDLYWMDGYGGGRPALIGYWQTKTFVFGVLAPSGVVTATGTEEFDGCLDANGDRSCGASEPSGTLRFSFQFSGKYDLVTFARTARALSSPDHGRYRRLRRRDGRVPLQGRPRGRVLVLLGSPHAGGMSAAMRRPGRSRPPALHRGA